MSRVTKHLGFGVTYSTTFMHPYYLARLFNSLDHVTGGRIAFNVITSTRRSDYANYGYDELIDHDERYDRMEEFIDVCRTLWDSVEPDAMLWDHASGQVGDPAKVHDVAQRERLLTAIPLEGASVYLSHNSGYDFDTLPPADLAAIADLLVPELQRRGRFRTEYRGATLRENLFDDGD
jgi:alkanesulfonate monooxygenase SsuD/methylene tetrahydromethanopterin reductase-like flavin-dependent oxidoreductase (luciferase family)